MPSLRKAAQSATKVAPGWSQGGAKVAPTGKSPLRLARLLGTK